MQRFPARHFRNFTVFPRENLTSITYAKLGVGGLTACIIGSPRNVSFAVSVFSRGFSWGFDKRHEFIPNESLDWSIRVFEYSIKINGNRPDGSKKM